MVKKQKYWVLNAKVITLVSAITILVTLILVFILGHKSFLVELERSVAVISIVLFLFLSHCLYRGVRLKYEPIVRDKPYNLKFSDKSETLECIPDLLFNIELAEAGLVWIIFSIVATILLFVFGNVLIDVFIFAVGAIYWVFYRALRLAIIKSRQSKGKLLVSLGYSFVYTLLYTGWLYAVFFGYKIFVH